MSIKAALKSASVCVFSAAFGISLLVHSEISLANTSQVVDEKTRIEARNESFKKSYPDQFETWQATGESELLEDALKEDPNMVIMWAGYGFSKDYNKARGHFYAIEDIRKTLRTGGPKEANSGPMPMACWSCKGPDVARLIEDQGEEAYFSGKWARLGAEITNPIGCADCHDTGSEAFAKGEPALKLSRPYAERAMEAIDKPFDKQSRFTQQSQVCGQCHVEYYFASPTQAVTFPWQEGVTVEKIENYFDDIGFKDWTHQLSKAPMLKAQHPEFETWSQGIHGKNDVGCIDCHMPKVQNAQGKVYTDHKIGNPFDNFKDTCANCHTQDKKTMQDIVSSRKQQVLEMKLSAEKHIVAAHFEAAAAWDAGATQAEMEPILLDIRHAQWRWDYAIASHGIHMHAPEVALKSLGMALDKAADARTKLVRLLALKGINEPIKIPDISTKAKAQALLGMDMEALNAEKADFLKTVAPKWDADAKQREGSYP